MNSHHVCCMCNEQKQTSVNCLGSNKYNCDNVFCYDCRVQHDDIHYCQTCDNLRLERERNNRRYKIASMVCSCLGVLLMGVIRIFVR
jgi:hypothetical protein